MRILRVQVLRFREKPKPNGVISAGFFVFNRGLLDYLGAWSASSNGSLWGD